MSQRILLAYSQNINPGKDDAGYDAFFTEKGTDLKNGVNILKEWIAYNPPLFVGPFKIYVRDIALWPPFEEAMKKFFFQIRRQGNLLTWEDIWMIFYNGNMIEHPTEDELRRFLAS